MDFAFQQKFAGWESGVNQKTKNLSLDSIQIHITQYGKVLTLCKRG